MYCTGVALAERLIICQHTNIWFFIARPDGVHVREMKLDPN